jgi:hypothetical protein
MNNSISSVNILPVTPINCLNANNVPSSQHQININSCLQQQQHHHSHKSEQTGSDGHNEDLSTDLSMDDSDQDENFNNNENDYDGEANGDESHFNSSNKSVRILNKNLDKNFSKSNKSNRTETDAKHSKDILFKSDGIGSENVKLKRVYDKKIKTMIMKNSTNDENTNKNDPSNILLDGKKHAIKRGRKTNAKNKLSSSVLSSSSSSSSSTSSSQLIQNNDDLLAHHSEQEIGLSDMNQNLDESGADSSRFS